MSSVLVSPSIRSLNDVHHNLNELFVRHQILLMHRDIKGAMGILDDLKAKYRSHIHDEELILLPLYQKRVKPIPPGGAAEFYIGEHRKIEQLLERFSATVSDWQKNGKFTPLKLVELFDSHYTFNDLLSHHHAREDTFLYRMLDRVLNREEKQSLFQNISIVPEP